MIRPIIVLTMAAALAVTPACAPLTVPPPFEEASCGWDVEPGRHVVILMRDGTEVRGRVEAVDPQGLVVAGTRVERGGIREMSMQRDNLVPALAIAVFAVGTAWLIYWAVTREPEPRPPIYGATTNP